MTITPVSDGRSTMYVIGDWAAVNNGQPYVDAGSCWWGATREEGWSGSPDPRVVDVAELPNSDGQLSGTVLTTARAITLGGAVHAASQAGLQAAIDQVTALLSGPDRTGVLYVAEPHVTRHALVRRAAATQVAKQSPFLATWILQLVADDPLRYHDPVTVGPVGLPSPGGGMVFPAFDVTGKAEFGAPGNTGQMTLINPGLADAFPTFTITGPVLGGVVLTDVGSGRQIVYAGDVPADATLLIIDSSTGTATLNGADRTGELTAKQWWPVPAGGASTVQFATLGPAGQAGTCTAVLEPADP